METNVKKQRSSFTGKIGFVLAAAGSAVGLGNIWRFPYLAAQHGGGIFLLVYIILALTFGFALMCAEITIGRKTGVSAIGAYKKLDKRFAFTGIIASLVPIIILPYYSVIGGWIIKYLSVFVTGNMAEAAQDGFFDSFISAPTEPIGWFLIYLALTALVVLFGVEKGIEKVSKIMMPVLVILTVFIAVYSLFMPGAIDGLLYYITPDFSKFSGTTVLAAMGQLFYSMSLAMGIMITYGSYMKKDVSLEGSVKQIELFDTGVALLIGMMIIPAVFVFSGTEGMASGPSLMFVSLPKIFAEMGFIGIAVGILFFVMVTFAALTSSVSVLEAIVANLIEMTGKSRKKVTIVSTLVIAAVAVLVCLGYNALYFEVTLPNGSTGQILDIMDYISNSFLMPIVSFFTCIVIGWVAKPQWIIDEVESGGHKFTRKKLYSVMIRYIAPALMLLLFLQSIGVFGLLGL